MSEIKKLDIKNLWFSKTEQKIPTVCHATSTLRFQFWQISHDQDIAIINLFACILAIEKLVFVNNGIFRKF